MFIILSPAKTFKKTFYEHRQLPYFQDEALVLIEEMKQKSKLEIEKSMHVSEMIAKDVIEFVGSFGEIIQPAIFTYYGAAYKHLDAASLTEEGLFYAEKHLRILSALFGILKPLDGISCYRLDFKDRILGNLYDFWRLKLSEYVRQNLKDHVIVNLASNEFSSALSNIDMITISFKSRHNGGFRTTSMEAKRMRGAFARMMIDHRIEDVTHIKDFVIDGYRYSKTYSNNHEYTFIKDGD